VIALAGNGSLEVKMRLSAPTRTQNDGDPQEAPKRAFFTSPSSPVWWKGTRFSKCHGPPPPPGSVEVRTSPLLSTAAQRVAVGQETPVTRTEPPPFVAVHVAAGRPGSVEVRRLPAPPPATQSEVAAQATAPSSRPPARVPTSCQAEGPPVGSVETTIRPSSATAAQSEGPPQETDLRSSELSSWVLCQ
jgi:hypothetical protein